MTARPRQDQQTIDPQLDNALRRIVVAGALLVLAIPAARGHSAWLGALPLWLVAMPLASWWALHRFRLPRLLATAGASGGSHRRRAGRAQARRRPMAPRWHKMAARAA